MVNVAASDELIRSVETGIRDPTISGHVSFVTVVSSRSNGRPLIDNDDDDALACDLCCRSVSKARRTGPLGINAFTLRMHARTVIVTVANDF